MILYELACSGGHRFEQLLTSMSSPNPDCECGQPTRRMMSRVNIGGQASPGPSRDDMPRTWRGIGSGDPATVQGWHKAMSKREKLEEKYPELAGDRRPVLAHEGYFANNPLKAGDALVDKVAAATFRTAGSTPAPSTPAPSTPAPSTPAPSTPTTREN